MKRREFVAGRRGSRVAAGDASAAAGDAGGRLSEHRYGEHRRRICSVSPGLHEQGFVEGRNVGILSRYAETHEDRLSALAADLVQRHVAAIFVIPNVGFAQIAKNATAIIPIVFAVGGDPVESGLVANLNQPGGNVTGATFLTIRLVAKRLEILHQTVPTATSIGYLINPNNPQLESNRAKSKQRRTALVCAWSLPRCQDTPG
jgi:putative tryptophan/tyrosine transport system substrate-binding protein